MLANKSGSQGNKKGYFLSSSFKKNLATDPLKKQVSSPSEQGSRSMKIEKSFPSEQEMNFKENIQKNVYESKIKLH